jgi:predicted nucleic acid-binding protein
LLLLFWDASALAKRYVNEVGSDVVDALFALTEEHRMIATVVGYAETYSTLLRNHNSGVFSAATLARAKSRLRFEVIEDARFTLLTVDDASMFAGLVLMDRYNVNATDAGILAVVLRYLAGLSPGQDECRLVASDHRLLTAARGEGLLTIDPETVSVVDLQALLSHA